MALGILVVAPGLVRAQHHSGSMHGSLGGMHHGDRGGMHTGGLPFAVGSTTFLGSYFLPYYGSIGPFGPVTYFPPVFMVSPGGFVPGIGGAGLGPVAANPQFGIAGPLPPGGLFAMQGGEAKAKKSDPGRSTQLTTFGDRLFRAGNTHRAGERYEQALRADPTSATPRVRLAQVALVRGRYTDAADQYRDAMSAEPGWLTRANDIQTLYSEPGDFARQIARLEKHLQIDPNDRDAWFVLGAQLFLSGRTQKAADIFLRLSDRRADATLAAFLDAATPERR